jgi:hypothetical protein
MNLPGLRNQLHSAVAGGRQGASDSGVVALGRKFLSSRTRLTNAAENDRHRRLSRQPA